jgi:hypothetical protein
VAKFLRHLAVWFVRGNNWRDYIDDPEMYAAVRDTDVPYLCWMVEHYATPLLSRGVGKVNICFNSTSSNPPPEVTPGKPEDKAGEGIAYVFEFFDAAHYRAQSVAERRRYYLDHIHAALCRCANQFGWDQRPLDEARDRILREDFRFSFGWKKPLASPDRRLKVQAWFEVSDRTRISLIFFDRDLAEQRRVLLCTLGVGSGSGEMELHRIEWLDTRTVCITQKNGRDYWLCPVDGEPEFRYPRGESGDRHGEYDLGQIYLAGQWVPEDRERGLKLIESAAAKGYTHAVRFLECLADSQAS